ncbi:hypothetical protein ACQP2F_21145 [Actinoplanes sp. CA-030573]|uniref:hypothetical protein n=1 Tax=Actinoplanes sp. CA-030573 TaxID=3239898 RepID=UPI003D8D2547
MSAQATLVFLVVVGARFAVPLFIPLFPLPAIVTALVLDGIDQSVFQWFGYDPPGYQGYDKAMDMFYLSVAYLSVLRNWTSRPALRVARFLFFYRLVGVVLFELLDQRWILLVFPNTFEYFFIAYEIVRLRWDPARVGMRRWVITAACIWIFVKLPQEWWIHVAQLDFTDTVAANPWITPLLLVLAVIAGLWFWFWLRPRLPAPAWGRRWAAEPLPAAIDTAAERDSWVAVHGRIFSSATLEKVVLIGLLCVIYGQVLPGRSSTDLQLFLGIAAFVVVNAAISLAIARRGGSLDSVLAAFGARLVIDVALVVGAGWLLGKAGGGLNVGNALFFAALLSLLVTLDDRFRPVSQVRFARSPEPALP